MQRALSADQARTLADYLRDFVNTLESRASIEETNIASSRDRRDRAADQPRQVAEKLAAGVSFSTALQLVADANYVPVDHVRQNVARHDKQQRAAARADRDRLIMRLAAKGWTNAEIGKHVDLHPVSVSRVISRMKRHT